MPAVAAAVELLDRPASGRVFHERRKVRLGDVDRRGRLRLDAAARLLQDVATDDADDADLDRRYGWLVRRTMIEVIEPLRLGEQVELATWCAGIGRSWAERRTSIDGTRGGRVEAVSLWVQIDVSTGVPARVGDDFRSAYDEAAAGRTVSSRLALTPNPPAGGDDSSGEVVRVHPWAVRRSDLDPFDHVNNAATWAVVEEVAALDADADRRGRAEMEYLQPVTHGEMLSIVTRCDGGALDAWLVDDRRTSCAARWTARAD